MLNNNEVSNMHYQAIIFDMDGTIVHTDHLWDQVSVAMFAKRNISLTVELEQLLAKQCTGLSLRDACIFVKKTFQLPDLVEQLGDEAVSLAIEVFENNIFPIEGFEAFHTLF